MYSRFKTYSEIPKDENGKSLFRYSVPAKITMDSTISAHLIIILNMYIRFPLYSSL